MTDPVVTKLNNRPFYVAMNATYTVVLLYPDYATRDYGADTFIKSVSAQDAEAAIDAVQQIASCDDILADDFRPIAVFKGDCELVMDAIGPCGTMVAVAQGFQFINRQLDTMQRDIDSIKALAAETKSQVNATEMLVRVLHSDLIDVKAKQLGQDRRIETLESDNE